MKAKYISIWDGGVEVKTSCDFDPETKIVSNIEVAEIEGLDMLEKEFVELENGEVIEDFEIE